MKWIFISFSLLLAIHAKAQKMSSFHDFKTETLSGEVFDMANLGGKKVLVVNVASECGFTPQYEVLQELYEEYGSEKFTIIAFPANNFGSQEPGTNQEIATFCSKNYGVTFPVMGKISVKGVDVDPIYEWLTSKQKNGVADQEVTWNFQKFMIDEEGRWVGFLAPSESPASEKILNWIEN